MKTEVVSLERDCEAIQIPSGDKVMLTQGTGVRITQSLGGSFTVITDYGVMVRIAEKDADALGKEVQNRLDPAQSNLPIGERVWNELKTCFDPEIPVNIVDLGLVYGCDVKDLSDGGKRVEVRFTLTAPGCGMGDVLKSDMESKLKCLPDIKEVDVQVVLEPAWDQSMMSEAARLQLGMM